LTTKLVILGAGTFAVEILDALDAADDITAIGFLVSGPELVESPVREGLRVFHPGNLPWPPGEVVMTGGIVTTRRRPFVEQMEARGFAFVSVVHASAVISRRASLGPGSFAGAGAIVAANTRIERHVVINRGASLGHDVTLGAFSTIGPGAIVAGGVTIGEGAYLGVGTVVRDHLTIGQGAVIAAGAVVVKPVPARALVAGCPAVLVRENVEPL
jgi:acetyltransferase EpsM